MFFISISIFNLPTKKPKCFLSHVKFAVTPANYIDSVDGGITAVLYQEGPRKTSALNDWTAEGGSRV